MKLRKITFLSLIIALISGCGGGEDNLTQTTTIPTQALAITSANAQEVSSIALSIAIEPIESSETAINLISVAQNETQTGQINLILFARNQLKWLDSSLISNDDVNYSLASITTTPPQPNESCNNSGTATIIFNDNNSDNNLSDGDAFSISLNNCLINEDQAVYNGNMLMTFDAITGDPVNDDIWDVAISFTFDNFSITSTGGAASELSGDLNLTIGTEDTIVFTGTLSGNKLSYTTSNAPAELTDYLLTFYSDYNEKIYRHTIRGSLASATLNGAFDITPITFFEAHESAKPHLGTFRVTGANNSSVTIEAFSDASAVQLRVDNDGEGTTDHTINTTWDALAL